LLLRIHSTAEIGANAEAGILDEASKTIVSSGKVKLGWKVRGDSSTLTCHSAHQDERLRFRDGWRREEILPFNIRVSRARELCWKQLAQGLRFFGRERTNRFVDKLANRILPLVVTQQMFAFLTDGPFRAGEANRLKNQFLDVSLASLLSHSACPVPALPLGELQVRCATNFDRLRFSAGPTLP
jgi:hypothetical protein